MTVEECIQQLSLEEKALLLQGMTTWQTFPMEKQGIPSMFLSDGPNGLRKQAGAGDHLGLNASVPATCFPTAATMANSWDVSLGEEAGRALGEEAAANDVNVLLGPGLNIKRSPLCGRNFEYFSEDPYLAGKMAAAYVRGIQENGVSACPKHFAVNSQEERRMAMDSVLDERTLREIYLTGFEIAVKEGHPKSLMSSYNMVNGTYANENKHLLMDILRKEWGFDGFVVTDWGADNDHIKGIQAGSNLVMPAPGADCAIQVVNAVKEGKLKERTVDARLKELLAVIFSTVEAGKKAPKTFDKAAHHAIAKKCAANSIVLLENDGILPLAPKTKVALIGDFAITPRYQGAGSSLVNATQVDSMAALIPGTDLNCVGVAMGYVRTGGKEEPDMVEHALNLAKSAEVVLYCCGLDEINESEGLDRKHIRLPKQQLALLEKLHEANANIVLVLSGGTSFQMPDSQLYRAAIHGYLGGQAGAGAMLDAITGAVNPSGKLNETWPLSLDDCSATPYYPAKERSSEYREGLFVGYRYYNTAKIPVQYPFGYGLSYTSFAYSDMKADEKQVTFTLTNTGDVDGAEVAQLYVGCPGSRIDRPARELKGFAKVFLKAGESKEVTIPLDDKAFRYFNVNTNRFEVEPGEYTLMVAANVEDVRLTQSVKVAGTTVKLPKSLPSYSTGDVRGISDSEFTALLGHPIPDGSWSGELDRNDAICQLYYAKTGLARLVCKILTNMKNKSEAKGKPDLNILFIYNMPFRAIGKMAGGAFSDKMVDDIVFLVNGHFWRGLGRLIADFFRNNKASKAFMKAVGK